MTTIGVAIAVPEPWGTELQRHRAAFGDPSAEAIPTHVTLVPPTEVGDPLEKVERHLGDVASVTDPFRLHLRGTATFRPTSPVVFVAISEGISACEMLAGAIRQGPLEQDLAFPYHPHVTVAHDIDDEALDWAFGQLADFSCVFDVVAFHLYLHGDDGVWRPERSYPLGPDRRGVPMAGRR
jgi:2'-5' RNA ligase